MNEFEDSEKSRGIGPEMHHAPANYYGDIIRRLFIAAGVVLLLTLPFFSARYPAGLLIVTIVVIALDAGLTTPNQPWTIVLDTIISMVLFCIFEYYAVLEYQKIPPSYSFMLTNQLVALFFFLALYFSLKTLRNQYAKRIV